MYGLIRINSNCSDSFGINSMYLLFARIRRLHYLKTSSGSWSWSLPSIESNGSLKYALNMLFLATSWTKRHFQEIHVQRWIWFLGTHFYFMQSPSCCRLMYATVTLTLQKHCRRHSNLLTKISNSDQMTYQ